MLSLTVEPKLFAYRYPDLKTFWQRKFSFQYIALGPALCITLCDVWSVRIHQLTQPDTRDSWDMSRTVSGGGLGWSFDEAKNISIQDNPISSLFGSSQEFSNLLALPLSFISFVNHYRGSQLDGFRF